MNAPQSSSGRTLRRIAADLAALHPDDVATILRELGPVEREAVEKLLDDYTSYTEHGETSVPGSEVTFDPTRLSPWLAHRIEARAQTGHEITEHVRRSLRASATRLYPLARTNPAQRRTGGMFRRMFVTLASRRHAT